MTGSPPPNLFERQLSRFSRKPVSVRNAARVIVTTTLAIVVLSGVAIRLLDPEQYPTIWVGMWWSLQTVTTVGYGDVTPSSVAGRLVGAALMLEGVALLTIVTAVITTTFVTREQSKRGTEDAADEALATQRLDAQLQDITERLIRVERMLSRQSRGGGRH